MTVKGRGFRGALVSLVTLACAGCLSGSGGGEPATQVTNAPVEEAPVFSVTITSPEAPEIETLDQTINLQGTVDSSTKVSSVTWHNDLTGEGAASGAENWETGDIELGLGVNTVTITATDANSNVTTDTIIVTRESEVAGSATLTWDIPTERLDGEPLGDLAGFRVYYGRMSENYDYQVDIQSSGVATYTVEDLGPGDWYFVVAAYDATGAESKPSNEAQTTIM